MNAGYFKHNSHTARQPHVDKATFLVEISFTFQELTLQRLYHLKAAHGIFVTGLEFAPTTKLCQAVTGNHEFTVFSISADNQVKIHQQPSRSEYLFPEAVCTIVWAGIDVVERYLK